MILRIFSSLSSVWIDTLYIEGDEVLEVAFARELSLKNVVRSVTEGWITGLRHQPSVRAVVSVPAQRYCFISSRTCAWLNSGMEGSASAAWSMVNSVFSRSCRGEAPMTAAGSVSQAAIACAGASSSLTSVRPPATFFSRMDLWFASAGLPGPAVWQI